MSLRIMAVSAARDIMGERPYQPVLEGSFSPQAQASFRLVLIEGGLKEQEVSTRDQEQAYPKADLCQDCRHFECICEEPDVHELQETGDRDSETSRAFDFMPGQASLSERVTNLISQGNVYKAVELLQKALTESSGEQLDKVLDLADYTRLWLQTHLVHERNLIGDLSHAIYDAEHPAPEADHPQAKAENNLSSLAA